MQRKLDRKGFSLVEVLIVIVIVAAVAACGWLAWRHTHNKKKATSSAAASSQQAKSSSASNSKSSPAQTTDPYAGWKSYCDAAYKYCFKYPSDWAVQDTTTAAKPGDEGGVDLLSPDQSVQVVYSNAYVKDGGVVDFVPTTISRLTSAIQDVTLVGGYAPSSGDNGLAGNNIPVYEVVDSSVLGAYPLTLNQQGHFPSNERFSDQYPSAKGFDGSLIARPAVTIETIAQSQAWLSSRTAQTAVKILASLVYSPSGN